MSSTLLERDKKIAIQALYGYTQRQLAPVYALSHGTIKNITKDILERVKPGLSETRINHLRKHKYYLTEQIWKLK